MGARQRKVKALDYVFHEGDDSSCMFIIKEGCVAIRKRKGAAAVEIAKLFSGEVLGELSFFDRRPRSASAVAITDVELHEIDFESLDKVYKKVPPYIKTIMAAVADRLRKANDVIRRLQDKAAGIDDGVEPPVPETPSSDLAEPGLEIPAEILEDDEKK